MSGSGEAPGQHLVQLFDDAVSLSESVRAFLHYGYSRSMVDSPRPKSSRGYGNEFRSTDPFTVLCGYQSGHFGNRRLAHALRAICALHTHGSAKPEDMLSSWLLAELNRTNELSSQTRPDDA